MPIALPLTEELKDMRTEGGVEVEVGSPPFIGMRVPGTYIVKIHTALRGIA